MKKKTKCHRLNSSLVTTTIAGVLLLAQTAPAQQWLNSELPPGDIAWWQAEGNMVDSAGAHNGSGDAAPAYAAGRFGQAFHFNGTDQSVSVPDAFADLDSWTQFTLEAWINLDRTADFEASAPGRMLFSKVGNAADNVHFNQGYQFGPYDNATKIALAFNTNGQAWPGFMTVAYLGAPLLTNTWYHLAGTYDHNTAKIYLNGVLLVTNFIGPVTLQDSSSSLRISKDDNRNAPFGGLIDDARIYNRALSAAEIAYLFAGPNLPVTQGLKLHLDASNANGDGSNPADGAPVNTWRDVGGLGLDATPLYGVAPVYHANALNGRGGVDFGLSGSAALATALSSQLNFTSSTIFMVGNGADRSTHVAISAPCVAQEFALVNKGIWHHSSPYHWVLRSHQDSPAGYYIQAGLFGVHPGQLVDLINGVASTSEFVMGQQSPTLNDIADYQPVDRQAIVGWRNSDAYCNAPIALEHFGGVVCEVIVFNRQLDAGEVDAMNAYLAGKYNLVITPIPPVLQVISVADGTAVLAWESTSGRRYQLQSCTDLSTASWTNEGSLLAGAGGVLTADIIVDSETAKFFRLQLVGN